MSQSVPITVYIRPGDPDCQAVLRFLDQRGLSYTTRDVLRDPSASAVLFGRLGRVVVPVVQVGDRLVVGYDPVQLARLLPKDEEERHVAFGAAVRSVGPDLARERGLAYPYGVEVGRVSEGSPAAAAGIQPGDLITKIGPYTLDGGAEQFRAAVAARRPGDTMTLTVRRGDEDLEVVVTFPQEHEQASAAS